MRLDGPVANGIWSDLIGQDAAIETLAHAVRDAEKLERGEAGPAMTHAWLITGPPGSGRSSAATRFAAALTCPENGCGVCLVCRAVPKGGHPDVHVHVPEGGQILIDDAHELIRLAAQSPSEGPWRIMVIEDADRLNATSANALLKSLEEPTPHTVWILCAPSVEDVLPTISSRTRHVNLRTPSTTDIAALLTEAYGIDPSLAALSARASQGHIGRARALATDPEARNRRQRDMRAPFELRDLARCFAVAGDICDSATAVANERADALDAAESQLLKDRYYAEGVNKLEKGLRRSYEAELKALATAQKRRRKRLVRDEVDRSLIDLAGLYRDVLVIQLDGEVELINEELRPGVEKLASTGTAADTARRLAAIEHARKQLASDVLPTLVCESLMVELKDPQVRAAS